MNKKILAIFSIITLSIMLPFSSFAGEWKQENGGWKYQNDDGSFMKGSWQQINNSWYYFDEGGYMLSDTTTPDGYEVNKSGEWIDSSETNISDGGEKYIFESIGEWAKEEEIPVGEYVYYPSMSNKIPVVKGSSCIANNFNYIKISKHDTLNPGTYVPVRDVKDLDIANQGMFLVGKDIKAGTYNLKRFEYDGSGLVISICRVFNSIPSCDDEYAPQKNLDKDFHVGRVNNNTVEVKDGQYIQLIDCTADFVRP